MQFTFSDVEPLLPTDVNRDVVDIYIADVVAQAVSAAPCLEDVTDPAVLNAAKAIIRQAVLRWHRTGEGGVSSVQETAGPFSQTLSYNVSGGGRLYPSELSALKRLCPQASRRRAFTIMPRLG